MAASFICGDCGGDGTRCDCHKRRGPCVDLPPLTSAQQAEDARRIVEANMRRLREMRRRR